ncbi:MAG: hypothetical protein ACOYNL_03315 [Rickettsiales bacterium]
MASEPKKKDMIQKTKDSIKADPALTPANDQPASTAHEEVLISEDDRNEYSGTL